MKTFNFVLILSTLTSFLSLSAFAEPYIFTQSEAMSASRCKSSEVDLSIDSQVVKGSGGSKDKSCTVNFLAKPYSSGQKLLVQSMNVSSGALGMTCIYSGTLENNNGTYTGNLKMVVPSPELILYCGVLAVKIEKKTN